LTCFARVCEIFTALVLTAAIYMYVCLGFRKLYILGATVQHIEEKRDVKLTYAMCCFKNLTVTFLFLSRRNYNSVPASPACITQFRVIERFCAESKNKRSHREALAVRIHKFLLTVLLEQGFPTFCFPCTP